MHDIVFIEDLKSVDELFKNEKCIFLVDKLIFSKNWFKRSSVAKLINEVEIVWSFEHIDVFDDMLIFFDVCEDIDLIDCTFFQFFIFLEAANLNNLDCVLLVIIFVDRSINFSVCTFSDYLVKSVILNYANHQSIIIKISDYEIDKS